MKLPVYLDHAATTPVADEVLAAMVPFMAQAPWNASALYAGGAIARDAVEKAREEVAALIGAAADEIYFTAGGTEADNWALKGLMPLVSDGRPHALVSSVEHSAVLESAEALGRQGWEIERLPVDSRGLVEPESVDKRITERTRIVSVMAGNNEVGVVQDLRSISDCCRKRGALFHTDAVQAAAGLVLDVNELGVDLLSLSSHKIYGPKGIGALFIRRGVANRRWMDGGRQEKGMRAGTTNVPAVVGFGAACRIQRDMVAEEGRRLMSLRDDFVGKVLERIPDARYTATTAPCMPHYAHFCFKGVEGHPILIGLDAAGVYASGGAACSAGSVETSHVLRAMAVSDDWARGAVRFTLGRATTGEELDYAVSVLDEVVHDMR